MGTVWDARKRPWNDSDNILVLLLRDSKTHIIKLRKVFNLKSTEHNTVPMQCKHSNIVVLLYIRRDILHTVIERSIWP